MTRYSGGMILGLILAVALGAAPLQAQRGAGFRGQGGGPHAGQSLDILIENQEDLGLTGDQLARIQEVKAVMDAEVAPLADEIKALREQIRTGEVDRNEGFRQLQALQGQLMTASAPLRGRVQEILTVEQHKRLLATVQQTRPGRGQGSAFQGRGGRGMGRGQFRGSRGGALSRGYRNGSPGVPLHRRDNRGMGFWRGMDGPASLPAADRGPFLNPVIR